MLYLQLIIFSVRGDAPVDNESFLVTDFVNIKIKPAQSFRGAYRGSVYVRVFIEISAHISIYIFTEFF
jgi:hypothetical protein